ncbi:MAG: CGNR zinc finger domain-containing protein, partial [Nocardioides sp.]
AVLDPEDRRALAAVTGYVRRAAAELTLRPGDEPVWHVGAGRELELPLLRAGWAAGTLLTSGTLGTVKACPDEDCGWLFLDGRGRRRWCSMSSCGNRAKVRAFAARQR